ncbi:hypothetical protein AN958_05894 [Leucoagaricus sp. SymC.cos]|nr:hypothetical protein AN958_05894 [Leucoagaricus sp. SymC.cos]
MPEFPGYLWAAASDHIRTRDSRMRIHFEEIIEPATNPPVSRMRIATGSNESARWIEVNRGEVPYVTVVDVQRGVIRWMKEASTRALSGGATSPRFSSWVRLVDSDGMEIEVELWTWRGLTALDEGLENWGLEY